MQGDAKSQVTSLIADNKVMVFSKSYCPFCVQAKDALQNKGVAFKAIEMDNVPNGADLQNVIKSDYNHRTVPCTFVDGKKIGGCDDLMAAISNGELKKALAAAGVANSL